MDSDLLLFLPSPQQSTEDDDPQHCHDQRTVILRPRPVYRGRSDSWTSWLLLANNDDDVPYVPSSNGTTSSNVSASLPSHQSTAAILREEHAALTSTTGASSFQQQQQFDLDTTTAGHLEQSVAELSFNHNKESPLAVSRRSSCSCANNYCTPPLRPHPASILCQAPPAVYAPPPPLNIRNDINLSYSYSKTNKRPPSTHSLGWYVPQFPEDVEFCEPGDKDKEKVGPCPTSDEHSSTSTACSNTSFTTKMMTCRGGNYSCAQLTTHEEQENKELPKLFHAQLKGRPTATSTITGNNNANRFAELNGTALPCLLPTMATPPGASRTNPLKMRRLTPAALPPLFAP